MNLLKVTNHLRQKQSPKSTLRNPPIHLVLRLQNQKISPFQPLRSKKSNSSTGGIPTNSGLLRTTTTQKITTRPSQVAPSDYFDYYQAERDDEEFREANERFVRNKLSRIAYERIRNLSNSLLLRRPPLDPALSPTSPSSLPEDRS